MTTKDDKSKKEFRDNVVHADFKELQRAKSAKRDEGKQPTLQGEARCLACRHIWVAVVPTPAPDNLECPACGCMRGQFIHPVFPVGDVGIWRCGCSGIMQVLCLRKINETAYLLCTGCGTTIEVEVL